MFQELNETRGDLDFTIEDLVNELDLEKVFSKNKKDLKLSEVKPGSKLSIFI
jgi:hypothetical protein